ncbi:MAG TPA: HEAT repeat domain-containing protein [Gemmataceae bacterium]|nr:HEAT repeat domain-containing protein [Gemmataceae bacterium]
MRLLFAALPLAAFGLCLLAGPAAAADFDPVAADRETVKLAGVASDDAALLDFFRRRTLTEASRQQALDAIKRLGDDDFTTRTRATEELTAMGWPVLPLLREGARDPDAEVRRRCARIAEALENKPSAAASSAAARLLARSKPAAAAAVLLAYLPHAEDDTVVDELRAALAALALRDGKPDRALTDALKDREPVRRGAAAEALIRCGAMDATEGRKFLKDADPTVRLWAAQGLLQRKDKEAVPPLIDLLTGLPAERAWQAEEVLYRVAGDQAPQVSLGKEDDERKKCRNAWADWWKKSAAKIDLAKLDDATRLLGYTLVAKQNNNGQGEVCETGPGGKERWKIGNLNFPIDAQVLPGDRVLIAEMNGGQVTERDLKGKVLWRHQVQMPLTCERLPNGHTFIAARNSLLEVDRGGKPVFSYTRNDFGILGGCRLRNGEYGMVLSTGQFVRIDARGKEMKSFNVGQPGTLNGISVLPNGRVLLSLYTQRKVVEYDLEGKKHWEASVPFPVGAVRLPNGNTLIACMGSAQILEVDRKGNKVSEQPVDGRPWRVKRR